MLRAIYFWGGNFHPDPIKNLTNDGGLEFEHFPDVTVGGDTLGERWCDSDHDRRKVIEWHSQSGANWQHWQCGVLHSAFNWVEPCCTWTEFGRWHSAVWWLMVDQSFRNFIGSDEKTINQNRMEIPNQAIDSRHTNVGGNPIEKINGRDQPESGTLIFFVTFKYF